MLIRNNNNLMASKVLGLVLVSSCLLIHLELASSFKIVHRKYSKPPSDFADQVFDSKYLNYSVLKQTTTTNSIKHEAEVKGSKVFVSNQQLVGDKPKSDQILDQVNNETLNRADEFYKVYENEISESLRRHYQRDPILRHLTSKKLHEMPLLMSSFNEEDEKHLEATDHCLFNQDELHQKHRISDFGLMALLTVARSMVYKDIYNHRFDNFQEMRLASGQGIDNEKCIRQLESLNERADKQEVEKYHSKDLNLFQLLDTWGRLSPGLLVGNIFIEGMYHECLRLKIRSDNGEKWPTRYCVGMFKHKDWPQIDRYDILNVKAGLCLPKVCDSSNYKNKNELIMKLFERGMRPVEQGEIKLTGVYCLPDEDSPLRSIRHSSQAFLTLIALITWIVLLFYCTYKHRKQTQARHCERRQVDDSKFGLTNMNTSCEKSSVDEKTNRQFCPSDYSKLYEMFSITNNLRLLFSVEKESSLGDKENKLEARECKINPNDRGTSNGSLARAIEADCRPKAKIVDLSCIEGIKVIAMVYVISGHVLMCSTSIIMNARELSASQSVAFKMANLVPAFAVNTFFAITGTLTCYMMFKQSQTVSFMTSPGKWAALITYRYLRIMPMYALVVLYCKTLAKYTGSGPLWDYATSSLGQRRACEQESWSTTILFRSNFVPPLEHCIPGGWYLSNDFQFFLITPFFMILLDKCPRLGLLTLYAGTVAGHLACFWSILSSNVKDYKPIATFAPHGFKTFVSHFSSSYTHPQYRLPAYLIGLIIGHKLYTYERDKIEYQRQLAEMQSNGEKMSQDCQSEPKWSEGFKRYAIPICSLLVTTCCITPFIGSRIPFTQTSARFMVAFITPSYHVIFAISVGFYLLLATTGHGNAQLNWFLSAKFWKPLARLSLCALLINVEVINYILQGNSNLHYFNNQFHTTLNIACVLATYAASVVLCVLFEAPIRRGLNAALTYTITCASMKQKRVKTN